MRPPRVGPVNATPSRMHRLQARLAAEALAALCVAVSGLARADDGVAAIAPAQRIEVIGTTPLSGLGMSLERVPANVQVLNAATVRARRGLSLADALDGAVGSVNINDTAGNPYQPDVNFRGFTASPALGTPQGLSVFVDGVRVNEAFGDTVNWDLIPSAAIARITVIPGSSPVFGRNTLGGALNVSTKTGFDSPGWRSQAYAGSFGRRAVEFELGGHDGKLGGFVTANSARDTGWGEHNPSRVQQLFASAGYRDDHTEGALTVTLADNRLEGNQSLPRSFMSDPRQAYTWPDYQTNRLVFVSAKLSRYLSSTMLLESSVYWRRLVTYALNSNVSNSFDPGEPQGPGNQPTGNAINQIRQSRPGASLQLSSGAELFGRTNQWSVGLAVDGGRTAFTQADQEAGSSRDTRSTEPSELATALQASGTSTGVYASDTYGIDAQTFITLSGRHERATVRLRDQIGTALNGDHSFGRFNPAVGLTHVAAPGLTLYAAYNEGMRLPTPVELSCADPAAPCSLPNAFASDPALRPVVSRTVEVGARGQLRDGFGWSAAAFRAVLGDDILFISSGGGATSAGYFQNVGQTRRQGLELALDGAVAKFKFNAHYSFIAATFESPLLINSPSNSTAAALNCPACSDIRVYPGDRLPGIPQHIVKFGAEFQASASASIGMNVVAQSNSYARGDENNRDINGPMPGFAVFNLDARYRLTPRWEMFAKASNVFDRRYATFGTLGQNVFTGAGNTFDGSGASWRNEQFRAVGAPRGIWVGLVYQFGEQPD